MHKKLKSLGKRFVEKCRVLLGKPATIVSLVIIGMVIVLHIAFVRNFCEYPAGIITECIGILVTVIFVQVIFDKKGKNDTRIKERNDILHVDKLLSIYFIRYNKCFDRLISQTGNTVKKDNFEYKDLANIYASASSGQDGLFRPAVECFFEIEQRIVSFLEQTLATKSFEFYPQIQRLFEDFICTHIYADVSSFILETANLHIGNEEVRKHDVKMIAESTQETYEFYKAKSSLNVHTPYIILFQLLKEERRIYLEYLREVQKIISEIIICLDNETQKLYYAKYLCKIEHELEASRNG